MRRRAQQGGGMGDDASRASLRCQCPHARACLAGLDTDNEATSDAWAFLEPYMTQCQVSVFSAADYVRPSVRDRAFIVHPGIAPLAEKNRELSPYDVTQVLLRAGLMPQLLSSVHERGCSLIEPPFPEQAKVYVPATVRMQQQAMAALAGRAPPAAVGGAGVSSSAEAATAALAGGTSSPPLLLPREAHSVAFLQRPVVTQVSGPAVGTRAVDVVATHPCQCNSASMHHHRRAGVSVGSPQGLGLAQCVCWWRLLCFYATAGPHHLPLTAVVHVMQSARGCTSRATWTHTPLIPAMPTS